MSDTHLAIERAKQVDRFHEASTGLVRDWAMAMDAKAKLDLLAREQQARLRDALGGKAGTPTAPMSFLIETLYYAAAKEMSDAELAAEAKKAGAELYQGLHGARRDPVLAENARKKFAMLDQVARSAQTLSRPMSGGDLVDYQRRAHGMSDAQLAQEKARLRKPIAEWHKDPVGAANARKQLVVVDAELSSREPGTWLEAVAS